MAMVVKKRNEPHYTSDFWYDLTNGGYIKPKDFLKNKDDIKRVEDAINVVREFERTLFDSGVVESQ